MARGRPAPGSQGGRAVHGAVEVVEEGPHGGDGMAVVEPHGLDRRSVGHTQTKYEPLGIAPVDLRRLSGQDIVASQAQMLAIPVATTRWSVAPSIAFRCWSALASALPPLPTAPLSPALLPVQPALPLRTRPARRNLVPKGQFGPGGPAVRWPLRSD